MQQLPAAQADLHVGDALLGLLVEEGDALLEAFLVGLPALQQLRLPRTVSIPQRGWQLTILQTKPILMWSGTVSRDQMQLCTPSVCSGSMQL